MEGRGLENAMNEMKVQLGRIEERQVAARDASDERNLRVDAILKNSIGRREFNEAKDALTIRVVRLEDAQDWAFRTMIKAAFAGGGATAAITTALGFVARKFGFAV